MVDRLRSDLRSRAMTDKRVAPRHRTLLPARIEVDEIGIVFDCTVRDLSETGARIEVARATSVPAAFRLVIPRFQRQMRVEQRWRRGDMMGVQFSPERAESRPVDDAYVRKLEKENARLRLLLEQIRAEPQQARFLLDTAA